MAHVHQCTGWTWDYILNNVDLPRLQALMEHWKFSPPVHLMLMSYFGLDPKKLKEESNPAPPTDAEIEMFLNSYPRDTMVLPKPDLTIGSRKPQ